MKSHSPDTWQRKIAEKLRVSKLYYSLLFFYINLIELKFFFRFYGLRVRNKNFSILKALVFLNHVRFVRPTVWCGKMDFIPTCPHQAESTVLESFVCIGKSIETVTGIAYRLYKHVYSHGSANTMVSDIRKTFFFFFYPSVEWILL
jgi:hypothetical protein